MDQFDKLHEAQVLLNHYHHLASIDRDQKILEERYGKDVYADIRFHAMSLWLRQNGFLDGDGPQNVKESQVPQKAVDVAPKHRPRVNRTLANKKLISSFNSSTEIAQYLLREFGPVDEWAPYEPKFIKQYGGKKYKLILNRAIELEKQVSRSVVTNKFAEAENQPPLSVTLKVEGLTEFGGVPCYKVKYSPDEQEPYDWFVPTQNTEKLVLKGINCIFHNHKMTLDPKWICALAYKQGESYLFTVKSCLKFPNCLKAELEDPYGLIHLINIPKVLPSGMMLKCRVRGFRPEAGIKEFLSIKLPDLRELDRQKSLTDDTRKAAPDISRKAMEVFDMMKELGFHKCGREFTCSCCGETYGPNQGIVCDVRQLYLCNQCRAGQRKRERTTKSVRTIPTPMGNKR